MKIAIGCDPNAEEAKQEIIAYIEKKGYGEVTDFGSEDPIYANVAIDVAEHVASGEYDRGVLICGTGLAHDVILSAAVEKYEDSHDNKLPVIGKKDTDFVFDEYKTAIIDKDARKAAKKAETKYFSQN